MTVTRERVLGSMIVLWGLLGAACGPTLAQQARALADQARVAEGTLGALRAARFEDAGKRAAEILKQDGQNPYAHLVAAVSQYRTTMHQLMSDVPAIAIAAFMGTANHKYMRFTLSQAEEELARVDGHLAAAARYPGIALELCLACWQVDWNRNGRVDRSDERLFQVEQDARGKEFADDDPRRKPTFRFDQGDVLWARAFISFQRAVLKLVLAYRWTEIGNLRTLFDAHGPGRTITVRMDDRAMIDEVRRLLLTGLDLADAARRAYLAETDDDREWLPNPRQQNHPLPLPVDEELYRTWELVVGDLRRIVSGEEGISVAELAQLGDHKWDDPPQGYLDLGGMLSRPKDIVLDFSEFEQLERRKTRPETSLRNAFGEYYRAQMKPSPLLGRLARMKREIDHGQESFERKLRYLLWLN